MKAAFFWNSSNNIIQPRSYPSVETPFFHFCRCFCVHYWCWCWIEKIICKFYGRSCKRFPNVLQRICAIFNFIPVQFAKSDILHSDWIMSQWWLHWPRKCKSQHSMQLDVLRSNFNFEPPSIQTTPQSSRIIHWKGWQLFALWCHCWGCLTITAAVSSSVDAYVCTIWTNPATCDRSTVSPCVLQSYYRAQTFSQSLKSRRKMGRRYGFETNLFEGVGLKDCFLAVGLHVSLIVEMRGETMPIRDLLLQSMITPGCQPSVRLTQHYQQYNPW